MLYKSERSNNTICLHCPYRRYVYKHIPHEDQSYWLCGRFDKPIFAVTGHCRSIAPDLIMLSAMLDITPKSIVMETLE